MNRIPTTIKKRILIIVSVIGGFSGQTILRKFAVADWWIFLSDGIYSQSK